MSIYDNPVIIKIGDFFFKYRNKAFPLMIVALFVLAPPPTTLFSSTDLEIIKDWVAVLIATCGLALRAVVIGYAYIKRGGLNKKVYADKLVTEGMFSLCRNPLYVGNMLIYSGVFLMHGAWQIVIAGIALFYFIYVCIIAAEEKFLKNKFGKEYDKYAATTSRWWVNFAGFKAATEGMEFKFKKVIVKDYTTIFNTYFILLLTEAYEDIANGEFHGYAYTATIYGLAVTCMLLLGLVSYLKRHKILTA